MNFDLSEEQQLVQDSVARFIQDNYDLEARQATVNGSDDFNKNHWATMAELGWLGLTLPEAHGGFGGNQIDAMVIMEQFGKGLVLEPFFASIVLGARAVSLAGSEDQCGKLLPGVIDGSRQLALGYAEEQARFDMHDVVTRAQAEGDGYVINGRKSMVQHGGTADQIIISARTSGGQSDTNGISLFIIDADTDGLTVTGFPTVDGLAAAEVELKDVSVGADALLGELDSGYKILEAVAIDGILAVCAEAVGAMEMLYKDTVEYTQEREQFDHPLADFQVLQHRMVEMFMEYEQCKSLLYRATLEVVQNGTEALRTVHALKHFVGKTGIFIGENAVQLHGGMGVTEELRIGHYFKRLLVIDAQFGNSDYHLQQFAA
ncbi:MAG: acyl-CoA dehydrogenase family protein [Pseudomonadaceae bacterium]|nr:acyl-CoA dehydrogenase family protein [Pseudomonadaceae bacterium]